MVKLRHACQYREEEAKNLFTTEFTGIVIDIEYSISIEIREENEVLKLYFNNNNHNNDDNSDDNNKDY